MQDCGAKLCLVSSSGGHFEQLLRLLPLLKQYDGYFVTEETSFDEGIKGFRLYRVPSINRTDKHFLIKLVRSFASARRILRNERPDVIVSTGALPALPTLILGKLRGCKIIYIESFAKINSPNMTGKVVYKFADLFFVQWESMLEYYPRAMYRGGIY